MGKTFYLHVDGLTILGSGYSLDGAIPDDSVVCTQEQHDNWQEFTLNESQSIVAKPLPLRAATIASERMLQINTAAALELSRLSSLYPAGEVQSWAQQTREAEALTTDPNAVTPLLTAIASARGITIPELAARVRAKVAAYAVASGQIIGQRQALEDALMAVELESPDAIEQLEAITWPAA